jgi:hypothetical protein
MKPQKLYCRKAYGDICDYNSDTAINHLRSACHERSLIKATSLKHAIYKFLLSIRNVAYRHYLLKISFCNKLLHGDAKSNIINTIVFQYTNTEDHEQDEYYEEIYDVNEVRSGIDYIID